MNFWKDHKKWFRGPSKKVSREVSSWQLSVSVTSTAFSRHSKAGAHPENIVFDETALLVAYRPGRFYRTR